ncbi:MAG: molybdopterin oxidoreductase [Bacteriovoracaceae bacterium]|nr:molybdopterin oxidoreductase [Bacteriovoracaceae bacterium]
MSTQNALQEEHLVQEEKTYRDVSNEVCKPLESFPTKLWWIAFTISASVMAMGFSLIGYMIYTGVGLSGIRSPVGWGMMIVTFVFWIGIGHAGTLISAILFLFRQKWRTAINRSAEAMTIIAVMCAGIFPLIHTGRPWYSFYWLFPYPNQMGPLWVNFRSPLLWDVFAVSTYLTISVFFWYTGLVPDLATVRDRAKNFWRKKIYGILALGWRGSSRGWHHYEVAYWVLAGLSAPLVLSVHTIVSFDFAVSIVPGWHTTIFPPYFVAGAIFSGFAMVVTLLVIAREVFGLKQYITMSHLDSMNKIILATGMMVGLAYATEFFIAWYSGVPYERAIFLKRALGPFAWAYWTMVACNVLTPQFFWFKACRRSIPLMFVLSIFVNIGMWFERFVIVVTSLSTDYLPSSWKYFSLTAWDVGVLIGSFGMFFTLFLLFCRLLPTISIAEVKSVIPPKEASHGH